MQKNIVYSLLYMMLAVLFAGCSKMDDPYKEYVVPGGITYLGKADSVTVYPGRGRVKLTWLRGTDPNITEAIAYWNNKADSLIIPVKETNPKDRVALTIDNLPENTYTIYLYTRDNDKNSSIRVDVQAASYGAIYENTLLTRPPNEVRVEGSNLKISWLPADSTMLTTEVNYTGISGAAVRVFVPKDSAGNVLKDWKEGTPFTYRTYFMPAKNSLDTFYSPYATQAVNLAAGKTTKQSSGSGTSTSAALVDQNKTTFWQPAAADRTDDKKVWFTIDLKGPVPFNEVKHFWKAGNNLISGYAVFVSDNETNWQQVYEKKSALALEETASFPETTKRYVKLEFTIGGTDGNINITEAEIYKR